jgi:hypothetical protein
MSYPIGDTERAKLGEIAVIEDQNEMRRLIAETFEHMGMSPRKVPNISGFKIVRLGLPRGVDHCRANTAFDDESPLGCSRMPMKFAHHARLQLHRDARNSFGAWQLFDSYFLAKAVPGDSPFGFLQFKFETRQFFFRQQGIRHIILKTELAHGHDLLRRFARIDQANPASCAAKLLDHCAHESNFHAARSVVSIGRDSNDARRRLSQIATAHVNRSRCVRACSSRMLLLG